MGKGAAFGTVLGIHDVAIASIALSLPDILRNVLKPRLIAVFACVVALGILTVDFIFNLLPLERIGGSVSVL